MTAIRLVLFDALHTIITPRLPIHIQYAQVFESHLGQLDPLRVREGFKRGKYIRALAIPWLILVCLSSQATSKR